MKTEIPATTTVAEVPQEAAKVAGKGPEQTTAAGPTQAAEAPSAAAGEGGSQNRVFPQEKEHERMWMDDPTVSALITSEAGPNTPLNIDIEMMGNHFVLGGGEDEVEIGAGIFGAGILEAAAGSEAGEPGIGAAAGPGIGAVGDGGRDGGAVGDAGVGGEGGGAAAGRGGGDGGGAGDVGVGGDGGGAGRGGVRGRRGGRGRGGRGGCG